MMLTYHNLNIEIQTEGIISIASLHIMQRLNEHGKAMIKAVVEEEKAPEMVEQAVSSLSVRISRSDEKKQTVFCGRIEEIRTEKENGLFYLYMNFSGYTREWDLTDKSQSYCKGNDTYEQVLNKALSEYGKAQIRDETTGGARIPGILMQYEETDWTFLKRLASHFSTFVLADNTAEYGKAYFGIPHMDYGTVLEEEEYTLLKGKERYEKLENTGELMPQEMMSWRLKSLKHMQFGEQVMLGYIETVVTAVDIRTEMEDLVYEYELSRRKGILTSRKTNPKIYGMSIPATVKERKGNQVRVQLDIDPSYEPSSDLKWFTYAIETSNFYCMPEEGSRVHIYFSGHEEQSAMAVHALRTGGSSGSGSGSGGNGGAAAGGYASSGSSQSGGGGSSHSGSSGGSESGGSSGGGAGAPTGGAGNGMSAPAGDAAMPAVAAAEAEKEEQAEEEKDPDYKVFSDPSGSYLELAPYGITFSPGNGSTAMMLQKTGSLSLSGLFINFFSDKSNILVGTGKQGNVENIYVEAEESIQMSLKGGDSQITMNEETNIIATFVRKDAELKNPALPLASEVRSNLTATDAQDRAEANAGSKEALTEMAGEYKKQLEEKEARAKEKVKSGILSILTVVAAVAVVAVTGGAAAPLVAAMAVTGGFKVVSGIADIAEGVSDLDKVQRGDLSQSYNFMRDGVFGGNEALYEITKGVNDLVFSVVTCRAVNLNLDKVGDASKIVKTIKTVKDFAKEHEKGLKILNTTMDVVSACYEDYKQTGSLSLSNIAINIGAGSLKGYAMSNLRIGCQNPYFKSDIVRKVTNGLMETGEGMLIDWGKCQLTGYPYDPLESFKENINMAKNNEMICEPVDAVSGSYLIKDTDMYLPDISEPVSLERSYSSSRMKSGWLGKGWHFTYEGRLYIDGGVVHGQLPCGYCISYRLTEDGFEDILGNGRFTLSCGPGMEEWNVTDTHRHIRYCYSGEGLLKEVIDRNGQKTVLSYENGNLSRIQTALGYAVSFEFHEGKLALMKDDTGRCLKYHYENGLLTEVVHMDGGVTRYKYSEEGFLIRPTDQTGVSYLANKYDEKGRVVLQTLSNGDTYRMRYDDRERKVFMEYSYYPGVRQYAYNEKNIVSMVVYPDGSRKLYDYDERGNRVLETDQLGRNTRWEYDAWGHLVKEIKPEGLVTEYLYDEAGDLACVCDNGGREKFLAYDTCHNLVLRKIKTAEGRFQEQSYAYDSKGRLIKETDGEGHETIYHYEEDCAYPSLTTYSDGTELKCEYSRNGRKLFEDDGAVRWEYAYNQGGWRTMERDGEGNETHYLYDGMGRKLAKYAPMQWKGTDGKRTDYRYGFLDRLIDTIYPDGSHERLLRDGEGNILKKVHPNSYEERTKDGEGTCYDYDGENRLLRIHYPDGGVERFFYDAAGNRIKHVLPEQYDARTDDGEGWSYTYDAGNRLTSVTGPDGVLENTYIYDLWGNCVRKTDEKGCSTYYAYDLNGRLKRELVPVGEDEENVSYRKTSYEYDDNGNRIKEIRHGGSYGAEGELLEAGEDLALAFAYDAKNRLVCVEDGLGARISYQYDARGNRISEEQVVRSGIEADENAGKPGTRAVLKKIRYSYDRAGRLVKKSELLDDGLTENTSKAFMTAVTSYDYDANGNRTSIITPEGSHISRSYDDRDRLITERVEDKKNDIDRLTSIAYDKAGNIISVRQSGRDGQTRELSYSYDLKDRLTHMEEFDGPVFELVYDKNDRRKEQKQLLPADGECYEQIKFRYDMRGNLLERYGNDILLEQNTYDIRGRRLTNADGDGVEAGFRYGIQNEILEASTRNSRKQGRAVQRLAYDAWGRITGIEDGCGGQTFYQLDAWRRITGIDNAEGGREQYAYDQAGNITETVDARGGKIRYAYNSIGKVCAVTDQLGNTETFHYDKEGRLIQHTDRKGILTETRYNVYGQPVMQVCTDRKGNRHVMGTWEYDDLGQLKKSVAGGFCYTYLYRPDGKLLKKWSSGKQVIACDYYKNGVLKSLTDISGKTLHYGYDEAGRLSSFTDDEGKILIEYAYTAAGRLKEIRTPEGLTASYEYDNDGNISHLRIGNEEKGSLLYDAFMLYDLNGNRTGRKGKRLGADGILQKMDTAYSYDRMNRLTEEKRSTDGDRYAYDLAGNRLKKQHYNYALTAEAGQNRDSTIGTINTINSTGCSSILDGEETYCYNERNELTEKKTLSVVTEYLYDENGSLVREKEGSKTASYQYDLLNRQIYVKTLEGREQENFYDGEGLRAGISESGKEATFIFYKGEILAECNGDRIPIRRHLAGLGLSNVQTLNDDVYHAYHQNEQGSTAYITGNNGSVENSYAYDAFGNVTESWEDINNRILYTGQQYDQETGQYCLRARFYNPVIGRFTQEDTYRGDGLNLYAYCGNNPVIYYDPSGHGQTDYVPQSTTSPEKPKSAEESGVPSGYYQDANGRWHRPNNQFASNAEVGLPQTTNNSSSGIHGNSLSNPNTNYGYVLTDKDTGEILKFGETLYPDTRYSQSYLDKNNAKLTVLEQGSKSYIHDWQYDMNNYFKFKYGEYPSLVNSASGY